MKTGRCWQGLLFGLALLLASATWLPAQAAEPVKLVASIRPLALLAEEVAGDLAEVSVLLPGTASPHHYSLRVSDMQRLKSADLLVWVGPEFERFLSGPVSGAATGTALTLAELPSIDWVSASLPDDDHAHSDRDMHVWLSPHNGAVILEGIAAKLIALRPESAEQIEANLAGAKASLRTAVDAVAAELAPLAERGFGVSHDGFGHFVSYFDLNQLAAVSAMPEQGLSARHIGGIVKKLKDARCLVVEVTETPESVRRLERLLKIPAVKADPLAVDAGIATYSGFIRALGSRFAECLTRD